MFHKLRERAQDEKGFTLIELLVVILIIGILAAIALPAFLNQRSKAQDSEAKSGARTVQTAVETMYTDSQSYAGANGAPQALLDVEPAIGQLGDRLTVEADENTYTINVESKASPANTFTIARTAEGVVTRTCAGDKCPDTDPDTAGNQW